MGAVDRADISTPRILSGLDHAAATFEQTKTLKTLCGQATESFRVMTGFDWVLVYLVR